jgi:hypothetical protein
MSDKFLRSIVLGLLRFERVQRLHVRDCVMVHIELPKGTNEANGSTGAVKLKLVSLPGKANVTSSCG